LQFKKEDNPRDLPNFRHVISESESPDSESDLSDQYLQSEGSLHFGISENLEENEKDSVVNCNCNSNRNIFYVSENFMCMKHNRHERLFCGGKIGIYFMDLFIKSFFIHILSWSSSIIS